MMPPLPTHRNEPAPFVYFDVVPTHGAMEDIIQIDLAARVLLPDPSGIPLTEFVTTGRLRGSVAAMTQLREAIDKTIAMLAAGQDKQHPEPAAAAAKLN
jgi:hypothetical protein